MQNRSNRNSAFVALGCLVVLISVPIQTAFGQSVVTIEDAKKSFVPSPLSSFDAITDQPEYFSSTIPPNQYVTHKIDLRSVLRAYASKHHCSMNEAFATVAKKLQMVPHDPDATDLSKQRNAYYRSVQNDTYAITARQVFFNELHANLYQLQYGNQQIVIEVRIALVPDEDVKVLQSFMVPNSFQAFGNQLPQVVPESTVATANDAKQDRPGRTESNGTFVLASESKTKALPTFIGKLDPAGEKQLIRFSKSRANMEIRQAPTLTVLPGTRATVTDASMLPFIVSDRRIEHRLGVSYQPVSQNIEDGTKMIFRAELKDGKIQMTGDLVFSKILGVETFDYPYAKDKHGNSVKIQVPEHHVRKVHWSTSLESGNTLLIDPVEVFEKEIKPKTRLKKAVSQKMRRMIMVKTALIEMPEDKSSPQNPTNAVNGNLIK